MPTAFDALKGRLKQAQTAQAFGQAFADSYLATAFGALPKSEVDLLVFGLLIQTGVLQADQPIYDMARSLNITPAKARNLLFQHQLRTLDDDALNRSVLIAVRHGRYSVDQQRLSLGIESPLVRSAIEARSKAKGVFADISLSGEILRIPMTQFGVFITAFLSQDQQRQLQERLQAGGLLQAEGLVPTLNRAGRWFAAQVAGGAAEQVPGKIGDFFEWVQTAATGAGGGLPAEIAQLFG